MATGINWKPGALAFAIAVCLGLLACNDSSRKEVRLVIKTPVQEMNTISNPEIRDVGTFLKQAANAFGSQYQKLKVIPEVKSFNYVDELQAVGNSFDTSDAPDVLFGAFFNLCGYIHTGRVVPLDEILTVGVKQDIDISGIYAGKMNGKTYMLPYLYMQNILIYNKELFRKCGLVEYCGAGRAIQDWSLPQWEKILDTLAEKLPKGTYPLAIFAKNNQGDTHILTYLRAFGGKIFNKEGNFDFQAPETVKALAWLQNGVKRGWFPPHPENLEMKDCSELFGNGQLAIYMFNNANKALYSDLNHYGFVNYPGNHATQFYNGFVVFDNKDKDKLQAAEDFLLYLYETDEWRDLSAGNIPVSRKTMQKYENKIAMLKEFLENSPNVVDFVNNSPNWQGQPDSFRSVFWPRINALLKGAINPEQCAMELDKACNAALDAGRARMKFHQ